MMHKAWSSIEVVSYWFSRSSAKFQGHTGWNTNNLSFVWVFPDGYLNLNSWMTMKWHITSRVMEEASYFFVRPSVKFQGDRAFGTDLDKITRPVATIKSLRFALLNLNPGFSGVNELTHWGRVTLLCVGNLVIIGSVNGLLPGRRQAIIWTNAGLLLIGPLGTNFSEILIEILIFSFTKMRLKLSSAKWRPFCLGLNELMIYVSHLCMSSLFFYYFWHLPLQLP